MANVQDCDFIVTEFDLPSRYYFHFRNNTLKKDINLLIPQAMG